MAIAKAELHELDATGKDTQQNRVTVQFNPETLKVTFTNQVVPPSGTGDQRGTSAIQFVGKGSTKLSVQLWFDVTSVLPQDQSGVQDVRELTKKVAYYITPKATSDKPPKYVPPGVRFLWGTFQFDGIMDSMEESLEYFSPEGRPLRASVSLSLTQQEIEFKINPQGAAPSAAGPGAGSSQAPGSLAGAPAGTTPLTQARSGDSLQALASIAGKGADWQGIALANGIENPRLLAPGQLIDLNASASVSFGGAVGVSASGTLGGSIGGSAGIATDGSVSGSLSGG